MAVTARRRRSERNAASRRRGAGRPTTAAGPFVVLPLALAAVLAVVAGCGLGDRAERAERVIDSVDLLDAAGPATGTMTVRLTVIEVPDALGGVPMLTVTGPTTDLAVDLRAQRAALGPLDAPEQIFDGLVTYGRRLDAQDGDARPWMKLDAAALPDGDGKVDVTLLAPEALRNALNPVLVLDLIAGALSGSVDLAEQPDTVADASTTRYDANFDIEKALEGTRRGRYPERDREAIYDELRLLNLSGRVFPGSVWLDEEGRPRRFRIDLRVSPQKGLTLALRLSIDLDRIGEGSVPKGPDDLELLETESLGAYLFAVTPLVAGR